MNYLAFFWVIDGGLWLYFVGVAMNSSELRKSGKITITDSGITFFSFITALLLTAVLAGMSL